MVMADGVDLVAAYVDERDFQACVEILRPCLVEQQRYVVLALLQCIARNVSLVVEVDSMVT